jgi:hypothetical protein
MGDGEREDARADYRFGRLSETDMDPGLRDRVADVTGASKGIGLSVARALATRVPAWSPELERSGLRRATLRSGG